MVTFLLRRLLLMVPTLFAISLISFFLIQLPPGDYLSSYIITLQASGQSVDQSQVEALRSRYRLDEPFLVQYATWIGRILREGDFGFSFEWEQPVAQLLGERLSLTIIISLSSLLFAWSLALPIGIYSAVKQYSVGDYVFTFLGFIGLATPNFMLALIFMYLSAKYFGTSVGGLFSAEYVDAPWSPAKFWDFLKHLWIPMIILGTAGTAGLIRIVRANLLDELQKPYVETARAKGLRERSLIFKYPVRIAVNPLFSNIGLLLPAIISGEVIVSVVLSLPTTGPLLLRALLSQDMYLAGSFVMLLAVLTVVGVLLSDLLLAWLDPRIRYS